MSHQDPTVKPVINVLDHGFVRLIDSMGDDLSVVRAARVSYDAAWRAGDSEVNDDRLLERLYTHHHSTPFEAVTFTFEVYAPIFIFRQWHRHRTQSYNELSARYRELSEEFYLPEPETVGAQHAKEKQSRVIAPADGHQLAVRAREIEYLRQACAASFDAYRSLLVSGWPRELARLILPVNTYSHMFCTLNLLNLLRFLDLRADAHAQWEMQQYADALAELATLVVPKTMGLWRRARQEVDA